MGQRSKVEVNRDIQAAFKRVGVVPDAGEEAFWEAVEKVKRIDSDTHYRLIQLGDEWETSHG